MRADRLLAIVAHLSVGGRQSATELAGRLEVSTRTIYRDIDALCEAGLPDVADVGVNGGFSLPTTFRAQFGWLTKEDVDALFVPQTAAPWRDLGLEAVRERVWRKVLSVVEVPQRKQALAVRDRLLLDQAPWFGDEQSNRFVSGLQAAIWHDAVIHVTYERRPGEERNHTLHPYALVFKAGTWYLVAADRRHWKAFRTSRLTAVEVTDHRFARDPDFSLREFWESFTRDFASSLPRYQARIRVAPELVPALPRLLEESVRGPLGEAATDPASGWKTLTLTFDSEEVAVSKVLSLGPAAEAVAPPTLRRGVAAQAEAIAKRYRPA